MNTKAEARTVESLGFEKTLLHKDGVNFNLFKRGDKIAIRKKLGLPLDKKIMISYENIIIFIKHICNR